MILFFLFQLYAIDKLGLEKEALFKFPAIHFDYKKSTGEWVALRLKGKPCISQVSEARSVGDNVLTLKSPITAIDIEILIIAGTEINREAGFVITTDKRKVFCSFNSTTELALLRDTLHTKFIPQKSKTLQSNAPVHASIAVEGQVVKCTLGSVVSDIQLQDNEVFKDISLYTFADTVAAFQVK